MVPAGTGVPQDVTCQSACGPAQYRAYRGAATGNPSDEGTAAGTYGSAAKSALLTGGHSYTPGGGES
jgi:hypothetical protein